LTKWWAHAESAALVKRQNHHPAMRSCNAAKEMLDLATHIVETKSGHFDATQFEDRYENALIDPREGQL
jgi:non-homologous end joining protein Ku